MNAYNLKNIYFLFLRITRKIIICDEFFLSISWKMYEFKYVTSYYIEGDKVAYFLAYYAGWPSFNLIWVLQILQIWVSCSVNIDSFIKFSYIVFSFMLFKFFSFYFMFWTSFIRISLFTFCSNLTRSSLAPKPRSFFIGARHIT